jgi:hypothetical protein
MNEFQSFDWNFSYKTIASFKEKYCYTTQCECVWEVIRTWAMLKVLTCKAGKLNALCLALMKSCLTLPGQQIYSTLLDIRLEVMPRTRPSECLGKSDLIEANFDLWRKMFQPVRELPGLSFFPIYIFEKESKMKWCYTPVPPQDVLDRFRLGFQSFLSKYAPKELFAPPPQSCWKSGGNRYNDGGTVRFDFEKAEHYDSGFKYQRFVTQPLQIREVWLPGRGIKQNSSYWFELTRPILAEVPYALLGMTAYGVMNRTRERIKSDFTRYDFYGFGLQFVRQILAIAMEEIAILYPNFLITEAAEIGISILDNVELEIDGKFTYPPRGIGLGYYETLKTLCIMSIMDKYDPIAIWGDEGLVQTSTFPELVKEVESYGFYFNHEKQKHYSCQNDVILWGGMCFITGRKIGASTPFEFTSQIPAVFQGKTHWERKSNVGQLQLVSSSAYSRLAYAYERTFGYEFYRGESMKNPLNAGVNPRAPPIRGWVSTANVERVRTLGSRTFENMRYEMPVSITKKHANRMAFARKRKSIFRGKLTSTYTSEYLYPKVKKGSLVRTKVSPLARYIPPWMEKRMMLYNNILSEKFSKGLSYEQMLKAALEFCYCEDPFDLYSRKGSYTVPLFHRPNVLLEDWEDLIDKMMKMKKVSDYATLRADLLTPLEREAKIVREAAILDKRRSDSASKDRINRIVFGDRVTQTLNRPKRKVEDMTEPDQVQPEEKPIGPEYVRYGSEPPLEGQELIEETFYSANGDEEPPDLLFIQEEPDRDVELVFYEEQFYPHLPL